MIQVNLPFIDGVLLMTPEPGTGLIGPPKRRLHVGVDDVHKHVLVNLSTRCREVVRLDEQDALALVSCVLNKIYYNKGIRSSYPEK